MPNRFVTVTPEERTKLYMISAKLLVSIDHIHPNDFGGNLKEFEEIAKENDVNTKFIKSSSCLKLLYSFDLPPSPPKQC